MSMNRLLEARRGFLARHKVPDWRIELLVYVYCAALCAFVVLAAVMFWSYFERNPALTTLVFAIVAALIYRRLRRSRGA